MPSPENLLDLSGKVALVTGSSRGIGRAIAETLSSHGANIVINSTEFSKEQAEDTVACIKASGGNALWLSSDLTSKDSGNFLVSETKLRLGRLDILVNNAGVNADTLLMRMDDEQWERVLQVKLYGSMRVTRAAMRDMLRQRSGSIIFISSVVAHGNGGQTNYAAANAGVEGFMKSVALEGASRGVRANAIAPGPVDTDMWAKTKEEYREATLKLMPLGRIITPNEVANTALFLASDMSSGITGQVINVNGGLVR